MAAVDSIVNRPIREVDSVSTINLDSNVHKGVNLNLHCMFICVSAWSRGTILARFNSFGQFY